MQIIEFFQGLGNGRDFSFCDFCPFVDNKQNELWESWKVYWEESMPCQSFCESIIWGLPEMGKRTQGEEVFSSGRMSAEIYKSVPILNKLLGKIKTKMS